MKTKLVAALFVVVIAVGLLVTAHAEGTPNLGSAAIGQVDSRWTAEARWFDAGGNVSDHEGNYSYSIGFNCPVNDNTDFTMMYSQTRTLTDVGPGGIEVATKRIVLSPMLKRRITGADTSPAISLSVGADVALSDGITTFGPSTVATDNDFTPAARLQIQWGQPGRTQIQIAGQIAAWDKTRAVSGPSMSGYAVSSGYGTVASVGGGIVLPISRSLTFSGDIMVPVDGDNFFDQETGAFDDEPVWSAGLTWDLRCPANTTLSAFATNALGPTLGNSILVSPENALGIGVALSRDF